MYSSVWLRYVSVCLSSGFDATKSEKLHLSIWSYSSTWAWFLRRAPSEYWRLLSQENCTMVKVFSLKVPASKHTKHQDPQQERKLVVKKPFCIQGAQKLLFRPISMMITVEKDTVLQHSKHRTTHWWGGHTWIHSGKFFYFFFLFLWNTFTWRLFFFVFFWALYNLTVAQRASRLAGMSSLQYKARFSFKLNSLKV